MTDVYFLWSVPYTMNMQSRFQPTKPKYVTYCNKNALCSYSLVCCVRDLLWKFFKDPSVACGMNIQCLAFLSDLLRVSPYLKGSIWKNKIKKVIEKEIKKKTTKRNVKNEQKQKTNTKTKRNVKNKQTNKTTNKTTGRQNSCLETVPLSPLKYPGTSTSLMHFVIWI